MLSSLHMVDEMQMAFYCIELVNEQGVTVSKMLSSDLFSNDSFCQVHAF